MSEAAPSAQTEADVGPETILLAAALLGVLEGLTEFLPVSSTGHLIVARDFFGVPTPPGNVFEVVIQLGAILAICVLYFARLWAVASTLHSRAESRRFTAAVLLAFAPAVIIGLFLNDFFDEVLTTPAVVASALIIGGAAILAIESVRVPSTVMRAEDVSPSLALKIGLIQCVAFVPGVSRSGASILGAYLLGVERKAAAEFSFFLAIPTMLGASAYKLYKNRDSLVADDLAMIAVGFIAAFLVALAIVKPFVAFVGKYGFRPFAWYRIALGSLIFAWLALA